MKKDINMKEKEKFMKKDLRDKINKLIKNTKAKSIGSITLYKGNFITLIQEDYVLPNGVIMPRERIIKNHNKPAVVIVAKDESGKYLLVVQNRVQGITSVEFPAGYVEPGEEIIDAAARELREETGYVSDELEILDSYNTSLGIDGSMVYIVTANHCVKVYDQDLDENEFINYDLFTFDELKELVENNYVNGAGNKLAYYEILNKEGKTK